MLRSRFLIALLAVLFVGVPLGSLASTQPNIILVTLSSVRTDRTGFLGSSRGLTPNLDRLAKESVVFERAYSQAPLTVVSHATILSGTYPQTHHVSELGMMPLAAALPYLPDLLHEHGYRTAAFVGSILLDPRNGSAQGFERGFDLYDAGFQDTPSQEALPNRVERAADEVAGRATKWLNQNPHQPFFLWVSLCDVHSSAARSYDGTIAADDVAFGKLVTALHGRGIDSGALIVVAADHGESLGAHGEDTHGVFLYEETIHVPLLVKLPQNIMAGKRVETQVRLLDIAPTILQIAHLPVPSQMQGQSLIRAAGAGFGAIPPVYSRSDFPQEAFGWSRLEAWRSGKYLYVRAPQPELYDLSADAKETRNLALNSPAILQTLGAQLKAFDDHLGNEAGKTTSAGLTASEVQKLASLGYVGLQRTTSSADTAASGRDPKDSIAVANQAQHAMLILDEGKPGEAAPVFREILAQHANAYLAQCGLGMALAEQEHYAEAIEHLRKAIELQPDYAWPHYLMGFSLFKIGDFKTSAIHLEIASERLPQFAALHSVLAQVYEHLGRTQDATREQAKAAQMGRN